MLVAPDHIESGSGTLIAKVSAADQGAISGKYLFAPGDTLYSKIRPYLRKAVLADFGGLTSADIYPLRPTAEVEPRFLLAILLGEHFSRFAEIVSMRSGFPKINREEFAEYTVALPPLSEQRRIVEILDALDEAIHKTEQLIAKLKQVKQGLLHDLLTRGINDNGELRDPARHPEQFKDSPVGRVPLDWSHQCLGAVTGRITDGTHQAVRTVPRSATTVPFLYVSCVRDGQVQWDAAAQVTRRTFKEISKGREPEAGMVLYTAVGSFGHAAVVCDGREFAFQRHIACIYPQLRDVDSAFLGMWLNSARIRQYGERVAIGNAQRTVTLGELAHFPVVLPAMEEQYRIVAVSFAAEAQIEAEAHQLVKLTLLKQGLMEDLLTGRVRVTNLLNEAAA